jgi:hypothetical protein
VSRSNRDHAKKKHRPKVEDEAIASQLEALLTPAITSQENQENYYRQLGLRDRILNNYVNGSGGANLTVARRGGSDGTDKNVSS